jgi:D-glycero-D-manno-heptose 1,7-bisphosphate phosphatase
MKGILLDRDGVILNDAGLYYIHRIEDIRINEGVIDFLLEMKARNYVFAVISNQGGIAKGEYTKEDTDKVHEKIDEIFTAKGIKILDYYYCPHHEKYGKCLCRKPDTLLLEKAIARFNLDKENTYFIGDGLRDVEAGQKAGLKTLKIEKNDNLMNYAKMIKQK